MQNPPRFFLSHVSQLMAIKSFWRGSGVVYLGFCLVGLLAGLWVEKIYVNPNEFTTPVLPVFRTLGISQVLFFLLAWPLILMRRGKTNPTSLPAGLIEILGFFVAAIPFYFVAAKFSDATLTDYLRTTIAVVAFCPLGLAAGRLMTNPSARSWILLGLVVASIAAVGVHYILREFLPEVSAAWIWTYAPIGYIWTAASGQVATVFPKPLLAWCLWVFVGILLCVVPVKSPAATINSISDAASK